MDPETKAAIIEINQSLKKIVDIISNMAKQADRADKMIEKWEVAGVPSKTD